MTTEKPHLLTIDRNFRPELPERAVDWDHPELINSLHRELDMTQIMSFAAGDSIDLIRYDEQSDDQRPKSELFGGHQLYGHLSKHGGLRYCLNLQIGQAIIEKNHIDDWSGRKVFLFQSVVFDKDRANYLVPFIQCLRGQKPKIYWWWLEYQINITTALGLYPH